MLEVADIKDKVKSIKGKVEKEMSTGKRDLSDRLLKFAIDVLRFLKTIGRSVENDVIIHQLAKSCTSTGANYEESQAASSKADFYNKIKISLRESRETTYWLKILKALNLGNRKTLNDLLTESDEIKRILGSISSSQNPEL